MGLDDADDSDMTCSLLTTSPASSRETDVRLNIDRLNEDRRHERPPRNTSGVELTGCISVNRINFIEKNFFFKLCDNWSTKMKRIDVIPVRCSKLLLCNGELSFNGRPRVLSLPLIILDDISLTSSENRIIQWMNPTAANTADSC